jgi:maltose/moltooligosaccharide transporter
MGTYLGLFNCTICLPQIVAALCGGVLLNIVEGSQVMMLGLSGMLLIIGSGCVLAIKD